MLETSSDQDSLQQHPQSLLYVYIKPSFMGVCGLIVDELSQWYITLPSSVLFL